jgi:rhamnogalacturonan endolyase
MKTPLPISICLAALVSATGSVLANIPGGGSGTGPAVTLTDSGSTVSISNGIVAINITKSSGQIGNIYYTYNNTGTAATTDLLAGNPNGGKLYWEDSSSEGLTFTYSLVADPANTGGNYAEIALVTTSVANNQLEVHYSLTRGATGFYVSAIYRHRSSDGAFSMGECRDNIYAGSIFNWMSVDAQRNRVMEVSGGSAIGVQGAPVEVSLWTNGIYSGQYEDKYKYSADLGLDHVWGWSSVGTGGLNIGLWNITASPEYYNGGPLKRELMEHIGTTVLNMLNGGHYGMGSDGNFVSGEVWAKMSGPYFIYCNAASSGLTAANQAAQALFNDAIAQGAPPSKAPGPTVGSPTRITRWLPAAAPSPASSSSMTAAIPTPPPQICGSGWCCSRRLPPAPMIFSSG